jgi:asparagine synthase (glutamine-hydrolysing)
MCGVLGSIGIQVTQKDVENLRHRGPDNYCKKVLRVGRHDMHIAHTRLAIQDLTPTGNQPMWSIGKQSIISFNGEIYNHGNLRKKIPHVKFKGDGDAETLVNYLDQFSPNKLNDLNGIFSFALAWPKQGRVVLVRDPYGVKPLYYAITSNGVVFSSELRSITSYIEKVPDMKAVSILLRMRYVPSPLTLLQGVKKLRPGHYLEIDCRERSLQINEYPYIIPEYKESYNKRWDGTVEQFGLAIESAIDRQMISDVEIGVFLSGGVDSAIVAALAQRNATKKIKAFTVGFEGGGQACEIEDAAETAKIIGLDHHVIRINFDEFLTKLKYIIDVIEEPLATTSVIPLYSLAELSSKYVKVVLSGQGADESMGGYARYWGELVGNIIPRKLFRYAEQCGLGNTKNIQISRAVCSLSETDDIRRFLQIYSVFSEQDILRLIGSSENMSKQLIEYSYQLYGLSQCSQSVERMMSLDMRMGLSDDLLLYTDKITMAHSIECRVPLLDLELVKLIESMSLKARVSLLGGKRIFKKYANTILPKAIAKRKKRGFNSPTNIWLKNRELLFEQLCNSNNVITNWISKSTISSIIDEYVAGYRPDSQIFLLLVLHYWFECYFRE